MAAPTPGTPPTRPRRWPRRLAAGVASVVLLPLALLAWVLLTEAGLRAAVRAAQWASDGRVVVVAPEGRLWRAVRIGTLRVETADLRLRIDDISFAWQPARLAGRHVEIDALSLGTVVFSARPAGDDAGGVAPPPPLQLPLSVAVRRLSLGQLSVREWADAPDLATATEAGPEPEAEPLFALSDFTTALVSDRRVHRIDALAVTLPFGALTLDGQLDSGEPPFALSARGTLAGVLEGRDYAIDFAAGGSLLELALTVTAQAAGVSADAALALTPFEAVPLRSLQVSASGIDPSAHVDGAPTAALSVSAALVSESADAWQLAGPLRIDNHAPDTLDNGGIPLLSVAAMLRWSPQAASAGQLEVSLPGGGALGGALDWRPDVDGASPGWLTAALTLGGVRMQQLDGRLPDVLVEGQLEAEGDQARQRARLDLQLGGAGVRADGEFRPGGRNGEVPAFAVSGALSAFDPSVLAAGAPRAALNLGFEAQGRLAEPLTATLNWTLAPSRLEGLALDGRGAIAVDGERLSNADVLINLAGNRVAARGAWGRADDALLIDVEAPALAALGHGLQGRARLEGRLSGTPQLPSGRFELFAEQLRLPGELRVDGLNASGQLEAGLEGPVALSLGASGVGRVDGDALLDSVALVIGGRRSAHRIDLTAATPDNDSLALRLDGGVREDAPAAAGAGLRWRGTVARLQVGGRFPLVLTEPAGLSVSRRRVALAAASLDAGERGLVRLDETVWTPERITARGALSGFGVELAPPLEAEPPASAEVAQGLPQPLSFGAEWDVQLGERANGRVRVMREGGDLALTSDPGTRLGLEDAEARLDVADDRLALAVALRGSKLGTLDASAEALLERAPGGGWGLALQAPLRGAARFTMPSVSWLAALHDDVLLGGSVSGDLALSGTLADPRVAGTVAGSALSLALVEQGLQLTGGELLAEFDRDRLQLTQLEFVSENRVTPTDPRVPVARHTRTPGRLSASGAIALDSGAGAFVFTADRLPILQRSDRWLILSGEGRADSTSGGLDLNAAFHADAGYIELADTPPPALSGDVVFASEQEAQPAAGGLEVSADVSVSLGDALYLSALGLDTRLTGELRLRLAEGAPLSAVGSIATLGGTFRGYGQDLSIERGRINFQGALDNPGLNVVALRKGLPVEAGISVLGSARRPQISLISQPDVPDPEKLSWIVLGRAPKAGGGADLAVLLPAAQALLGGSGGGMTDQLSRSLGFDEFGIGSGELGTTTRAPTSRVVGDGSEVTGEGTVSGQVLTLGKRLSSDLFLSFEQSLGGAASLVKLTYKLGGGVSVVARGGNDNSADVYYTVSFR